MSEQRITNEELKVKLADLLPGATVTSDLAGMPVIAVANDAYVAAIKTLRDEPSLQFAILSDLTGAHYPDEPQPFEVVVHLTSMHLARQIRVKVRAAGDPPTVPSLAAFWRAADWHEREAFDMLGIVFAGHPDPRRIFLEEDADFHPLRKEFPTRGYED